MYCKTYSRATRLVYNFKISMLKEQQICVSETVHMLLVSKQRIDIRSYLLRHKEPM